MLKPSNLRFRKSSYSGPKTENCIEIAETPDMSAIRDSRNPQLGYLLFGGVEWRSFIDVVKRQQF
ncbi:DUF397 domain-containing protein [Actinorugispora endophytica]|uniref:Uncharacterized protein DUF397 n=1 Tax=Actinorugispora endophytica TaxID=1605990 RepID=A0A4R6UV22_9ACTN|nr:DUF397 domain-containing protein [Actinorugispora endophytica]TDQ49265.1 uncharacterized protein DUF397 [Actinorugispora endophytica]